MPNRSARATARVALPLLLGLACFAPPAAADLPNERELRSWIEEFKAAPRGPFERIRWFCKDGSVLPPKAHACANHGGGIQHGEWNPRAKALRAGGYAIANVLASLDPQAFVGAKADLPALAQILIERFLIESDDGWIFRGARSYRGALQIEDEEAGSRSLVHAMLGDRAWREPARFLLLRETLRLLPLQADAGAAAGVRRQALVLSEKDEAFTPLRAKIHNQPDAGDAAKVRAFAESRGKSELRSRYAGLARDIDALYAGSGGAKSALALAPRVAKSSGLAASLAELGKKLAVEREPATRIAIVGRLLGLLRKHFAQLSDPEIAIEALQLSLALERDGVQAGDEALAGISSLSRSARLELLDQTAEGLYGAGLITLEQLADVKQGRRDEKRKLLAKPPEWADRSLAASFGTAIDRLAALEPKARGYTASRLRASLVPCYRAVVDRLER